jgi:hypothetical protein
MTPGSDLKDLVILAADKNMEHAIRGLLCRNESLRVRPLSCDVYVHPEKDPGCFLKGHDFVRSFHRSYLHAIVMFDREGCGQESRSRDQLEREVEDRLSQAGWERRAAAIVIDPELENWVWSNSPHVEICLGWKDRAPRLRQWLVAEGYSAGPESKPMHPKQAVEQALRTVKKPRSSSIYLQLAQNVTLEGCIDGAFLKFRQTISSWFALPD